MPKKTAKAAKECSLLEELLRQAKDVPPTRTTQLEAFQAVVLAAPVARARVVEEFLQRKAGDANAFAAYGKYIDRCLTQLLVLLLQDETTEFAPGSAARLWASIGLIPTNAALHAIDRLVKRDGWTTELADKISRLYEELDDALDVVSDDDDDNDDSDNDEEDDESLDEDALSDKDERALANDVLRANSTFLVREVHERYGRCHPVIERLAKEAAAFTDSQD